MKRFHLCFFFLAGGMARGRPPPQPRPPLSDRVRLFLLFLTRLFARCRELPLWGIHVIENTGVEEGTVTVETGGFVLRSAFCCFLLLLRSTGRRSKRGVSLWREHCNGCTRGCFGARSR